MQPQVVPCADTEAFERLTVEELDGRYAALCSQGEVLEPMVECEAVVGSRSKASSELIFFDLSSGDSAAELITKGSGSTSDVVQLVFRKKFCGESGLVSARTLRFGDLIRVRGRPGRTRDSRTHSSCVALWATAGACLLRVCPSPSRIETLLHHVRRDIVNATEASAALGIQDCSNQVQIGCVQAGASAVHSLIKLIEPRLELLSRNSIAGVNGTLSSKWLRRWMPSEERVTAEAASRLARMRQLVTRRQRLIVVLEDMACPSNAAMVLRNCDAFGVCEVLYVVTSGGRTVLSEASLQRVSSSANFWVPTKTFLSLAECVKYLRKKEYRIIVTSPHPPSVELHDDSGWARKSPRIAILFGNESRGVSDDALQLADERLRIDAHGMVDSLNLAVSSGVVLAEATRQRRATTIRNAASDDKKEIVPACTRAVATSCWQPEFGLDFEEQESILAAIMSTHQ